MLPPQAKGSSSPAAGTRAVASGRRKSSWKAWPSKVITPRPKSSRSPFQSTILPETAATSGGGRGQGLDQRAEPARLGAGVVVEEGDGVAVRLGDQAVVAAAEAEVDRALDEADAAVPAPAARASRRRCRPSSRCRGRGSPNRRPGPAARRARRGRSPGAGGRSRRGWRPRPCGSRGQADPPPPAAQLAAQTEGEAVRRRHGRGPLGEALLGGVQPRIAAEADERREHAVPAEGGDELAGAGPAREPGSSSASARARARAAASPAGATQPARCSARRRLIAPPSLVTTGQPAARASRKRVRSERRVSRLGRWGATRRSTSRSRS